MAEKKQRQQMSMFWSNQQGYIEVFNKVDGSYHFNYHLHPEMSHEEQIKVLHQLRDDVELTLLYLMTKFENNGEQKSL